LVINKSIIRNSTVRSGAASDGDLRGTYYANINTNIVVFQRK